MRQFPILSRLSVLLTGLLLGLTLIAGGFPGLVAGVTELPPTPTSAAARTFDIDVAAPNGVLQSVPVRIYVPASAQSQRHPAVLVAIHGMGSSGPKFAAPLYQTAESYGWVVVAPSFAYGDWKDPAQLRKDATDYVPALRKILAAVPATIGLPVQHRALVYGFSRGAQVAHRFALLYPNEVRAVAALSAGTYTLPKDQLSDKDPSRLDFPFGIADSASYTGVPFDRVALRGVPFWIGVGFLDQKPEDVPQLWTSYIGDCRVDRATTFVGALRELGVQAELTIFPNTGHQDTPAIRASALEFLSSALLRRE